MWDMQGCTSTATLFFYQICMVFSYRKYYTTVSAFSLACTLSVLVVIRCGWKDLKIVHKCNYTNSLKSFRLSVTVDILL